jgi:hypothetical protein
VEFPVIWSTRPLILDTASFGGGGLNFSPTSQKLQYFGEFCAYLLERSFRTFFEWSFPAFYNG